MNKKGQLPANDPLTVAQTNLREAEAKLEALRTEQRALPASLNQAAIEGDDVGKLKQRLDELPALIFGATVTVHRARIALCEIERARAAAAHDRAKFEMADSSQRLLEAIEAAKLRLRELEQERGSLMGAETAAYMDVESAQRELSKAKEDLQQYIDSQTAPQPVQRAA